MVSCSGPQFLPGTGVLSLKSSISLAGSLSPAARPAVRAADPTPHLQRLPATDTPGATICLTPPQEACHILGLDFSCLGAIPGLGGWRIGRKMAGQTPGKVEGWVRVGGEWVWVQQCKRGCSPGAGRRHVPGNLHFPCSPYTFSHLGLGFHVTWPGTSPLLLAHLTNPHPSGPSLDPKYSNFLCLGTLSQSFFFFKLKILFFDYS